MTVTEALRASPCNMTVHELRLKTGLSGDEVAELLERMRILGKVRVATLDYLGQDSMFSKRPLAWSLTR